MVVPKLSKVLNGELLHKNLKKTNSQLGKCFTQELYMWENLMLFIWEFWWDFKNPDSYMEKLCIQETLYLTFRKIPPTAH
jgi:hypothetical protein